MNNSGGEKQKNYTINICSLSYNLTKWSWAPYTLKTLLIICALINVLKRLVFKLRTFFHVGTSIVTAAPMDSMTTR